MPNLVHSWSLREKRAVSNKSGKSDSSAIIGGDRDTVQVWSTTGAKRSAPIKSCSRNQEGRREVERTACYRGRKGRGACQPIKFSGSVESRRGKTLRDQRGRNRRRTIGKVKVPEEGREV